LRELAETIGEQLRSAREERGIPLREVSDETRISIHYLEAIESNDYHRLPGGIFNRSFVKAYARYVKYDEKMAVEGYTRYMADHGEPIDEVATTPYHAKVYTDTPATRSPFLTVVLAIVILALLSAGALALLKWYQRRSAKLHHVPYSQVAVMNTVLGPTCFSLTMASEKTSIVGRRHAEASRIIDVGKVDYEPSLQ
jgi:cytoskeletal protein RodZ